MNTTLPSAISTYPIAITLPVAWGEMDALNHVNNSVYFKYFESARLAYMTAIGGWALLEEQGIAPVLASTNCRFKIPLSYPDTIEVAAKVTDIQKDRFVMQYAVFSQHHQKIAAEGEALVVAFDTIEKRKTAVPAALVQAIRKFEQK